MEKRRHKVPTHAGVFGLKGLVKGLALNTALHPPVMKGRREGQKDPDNRGRDQQKGTDNEMTLGVKEETVTRLPGNNPAAEY